MIGPIMEIPMPGKTALIARFMGPTWGPSGADRIQVGPILAPWTLLSGSLYINVGWGVYQHVAAHALGLNCQAISIHNANPKSGAQQQFYSNHLKGWTNLRSKIQFVEKKTQLLNCWTIQLLSGFWHNWKDFFVYITQANNFNMKIPCHQNSKRWSWNCLIFIIGLHTLVRWHLHIVAVLSHSLSNQFRWFWCTDVTYCLIAVDSITE